MFQMKVAGVGASVPVTGTYNPELEARFKLEPGWIERRTGIQFHPTASREQAVSDLAIEAGRKALLAANIDPSEIGLVVMATSTPDHLLPPTSPLVAHHLKAVRAGAIDLTGACSGFLYGLVMASATGQAMQRAILVIGANILSRRVDPLDRDTAVLFGDGAGAVVLVPAEQPHILGFHLGADGSHYESIMIPAGGSRQPLTVKSLEERQNTIVMQKGKGIFRQAIRMMADAGKHAMKESNINSGDVDWWIPHQANMRIIREAGRLLEISEERTITIFDRCANSSAATIPIALAQAIEAGQIRNGQTLLLTAVGSGMTSAGVVVQW